jgi:tetratricopeptide (TPR) repeat protein
MINKLKFQIPNPKSQKGIILYALFIVLILAFGFETSADAWRINKELQKELDIKKAAVSKNENDPAALFDLAITYAYTNHLIEGFGLLKKIHKIDPDYKNEALTTYIEKVTKDPANWKLRFRLAFAYYFNSEKDDAIREFENVLKIDPYNVWAYGYMALIYGEKGEINKGIEITKQGLKIDNNVAALHLLLSEGYYKKGDSWNGFLQRMEALRLRALGF